MPKRESLKIFSYVLISNQAPNRGRLNDYPFGRVSKPTTGVRPQAKWWVKTPLNGSAFTSYDEDIV